jgi:hypothetical protein
VTGWSSSLHGEATAGVVLGMRRVQAARDAGGRVGRRDPAAAAGAARDPDELVGELLDALLPRVPVAR